MCDAILFDSMLSEQAVVDFEVVSPQDLCKNAPLSGLVIKNTFFDIIEDSGHRPVRRFSTLPLSWRYNSDGTDSCASDSEDGEEPLFQYASSDASTNGSPRFKWASCASSECGDEATHESTDDGSAATLEVEDEPSVADTARHAIELDALVSRTPDAANAELISVPVPATMVPTGAPGVPPPPPAFAAPGPSQKKENMEPQEKYKMVIDHVKGELMACKDLVLDVTLVNGAKGWSVTALVRTKQSQEKLDSLKERAQEAVLDAVEKIESLYLLGYNAPFASMSTGFGCALAVMPDPDNACWERYSKGFCSSPGSCKFQHPKHQIGLNVFLQPSKKRR